MKNFDDKMDWIKRNGLLFFIAALITGLSLLFVDFESETQKEKNRLFLELQKYPLDQTVAKDQYLTNLTMQSKIYEQIREIRETEGSLSLWHKIQMALIGIIMLIPLTWLVQFTLTKMSFDKATIGRIAIALAILIGLTLSASSQTVSPPGVGCVIFHEGYKSEPYLDVIGVITAGFGTTKGISLETNYTKKQALAWLQRDLQGSANYVIRTVSRPLQQTELDALSSFVYNVGSFGKNFKRALNYGTQAEIRYWLLRYVRAGGKVWRGLQIRRENEWKLFEGNQKIIKKFTAEFEKIYYPDPQDNNCTKIQLDQSSPAGLFKSEGLCKG